MWVQIPDEVFWVPSKEGDEVSGTLLDYVELPNRVGEMRKRFRLRASDSDLVYILPDHAMLVRKISVLPMGSVIRVVCSRVGTGRGNPYLYTIFYDDTQQQLPF